MKSQPRSKRVEETRMELIQRIVLVERLRRVINVWIAEWMNENSFHRAQKRARAEFSEVWFAARRRTYLTMRRRQTTRTP
jgi:hypothetical protein